MIMEEILTTIGGGFLSNKGHGIDDMFFSMGFQILFFFFSFYPQRSSPGEDRWKNKPQNNSRTFKPLLVAFRCQEKLNKQRRPRL